MTTNTEPFKKTIRPGTVPTYGGGRMSVFCRIEFDAKGELHVTGVEGPRPSGNAVGSCGQIAMGYAHRDPAQNDGRYHKLTEPSDFTFAPGWTSDLWLDFLDAWKRWHLNHMNAECEHQRALGWKYDTHRGQSCPECGYQIGTEWKREEVPETVLAFLQSLPDTDRAPAWV